MIKKARNKYLHIRHKSKYSSSIDKHKTKIKFLLVGGWNTVFGIVSFILLYKLAVKIFRVDYFAYTTAQIVGNILAIINAYIFHKYITFESKTKGKHMLIEFLKFSTTYIVLLAVSLIIMPFFVEIIKIKPIPASICLNVIIIFSSYFGHSRFSFKHKHK